jgi:hypothetical protein
MAVIGGAAATLGVQVDRNDSSAARADDIRADHVADVNRGARESSGVGEGGIENRGMRLGGTYQGRVDDAGHYRSGPRADLTDPGVTKVVGCVPVGVGQASGPRGAPLRSTGFGPRGGDRLP